MTMVIPLSHIFINEFAFDNYGDPYRFSSLAPYYALLISSYFAGLLIFTFKYLCDYAGVLSDITQESSISVATVTKSGMFW